MTVFCYGLLIGGLVGAAVVWLARDWLCDELPAWDDDHRSVVEFHATRSALASAERGEWN